MARRKIRVVPRFALPFATLPGASCSRARCDRSTASSSKVEQQDGDTREPSPSPSSSWQGGSHGAAGEAGGLGARGDAGVGRDGVSGGSPSRGDAPMAGGRGDDLSRRMSHSRYENHHKGIEGNNEADQHQAADASCDRRAAGPAELLPSTSSPPRASASHDQYADEPRGDGSRSSEGVSSQCQREPAGEISPKEGASGGVQVFDESECSLKASHRAIKKARQSAIEEADDEAVAVAGNGLTGVLSRARGVGLRAPQAKAFKDGEGCAMGTGAPVVAPPRSSNNSNKRKIKKRKSSSGAGRNLARLHSLLAECISQDDGPGFGEKVSLPQCSPAPAGEVSAKKSASGMQSFDKPECSRTASLRAIEKGAADKDSRDGQGLAVGEAALTRRPSRCDTNSDSRKRGQGSSNEADAHRTLDPSSEGVEECADIVWKFFSSVPPLVEKASQGPSEKASAFCEAFYPGYTQLLKGGQGCAGGAGAPDSDSRKRARESSSEADLPPKLHASSEKVAARAAEVLLSTSSSPSASASDDRDAEGSLGDGARLSEMRAARFESASTLRDPTPRQSRRGDVEEQAQVARAIQETQAHSSEAAHQGEQTISFNATTTKADVNNSAPQVPSPQCSPAPAGEASPEKSASGVQIFDKPECSLKTIHKAIVARGQKEYSCFLAHMNHIEAPDHPGFLEATKEMLQPSGPYKVIIEIEDLFNAKGCDPLALMQVASNSMGPCLLIHPETTDPDNEFALYCKNLQEERHIACVELKPPSSSPRDEAPQWLYLVPALNLPQKFGLDNVTGMYGWVLPRDKHFPLMQVVRQGMEDRIWNVVLNLDQTLVDTFGVDELHKLSMGDEFHLQKFQGTRQLQKEPEKIGKGELKWCTRSKWDDRETSMMVHVREGWPLLKERLKDIKARVFVSTTESSSFAREVWRILDPKHEVIAEGDLDLRIMSKVGPTKCLGDYFGVKMADEQKLCPYPFTVIFDDQLESWGDWADQGVPVPAFDAQPSAPPPMSLEVMGGMLTKIHFKYTEYLRHVGTEKAMKAFYKRASTACLPKFHSIKEYIRRGCSDMRLGMRSSAESAPTSPVQNPITRGGGIGVQPRASMGNATAMHVSLPMENGTNGMNGSAPANALQQSELITNNDAHIPRAYAAGTQQAFRFEDSDPDLLAVIDDPSGQSRLGDVEEQAQVARAIRETQVHSSEAARQGEQTISFNASPPAPPQRPPAATTEADRSGSELAERLRKGEGLVSQILPVQEIAVCYHRLCEEQGVEAAEGYLARCVEAGKQMLDTSSAVSSAANTAAALASAAGPVYIRHSSTPRQLHMREIEACSDDSHYKRRMEELCPRYNFSPQSHTRANAPYECIKLSLRDTDKMLINRLSTRLLKNQARNVPNNLMALRQMKSNLEVKENIPCELSDVQMDEKCYWSFGCIVKVSGVHLGMGVAQKRKIAQHAAARAALEQLCLNKYNM